MKGISAHPIPAKGAGYGRAQKHLSSRGPGCSENGRAQALRRAADHLATAQETLESSYPLDMVTIDLRAALDALGEVTGHTVTEDLLDKIFSTFCIGK